MDLASLEMMEMADAIECLASAVTIQRQLNAAKNTIADLQERLKLAKRQVPCTASEQPIGNYTFKHLLHTLPLDVKSNDAFAVTLVALAGHAGDWTCYMGRAGQRPAEIAARGDKILEHEAAIFAHVMQHRHYRG